MSRNKAYANEMATANNFIIEHNNDIDLQYFLADMRNRYYLTHSDRWSICYDWLKEHYPEATGAIVTGLSYLLED